MLRYIYTTMVIFFPVALYIQLVYDYNATAFMLLSASGIYGALWYTYAIHKTAIKRLPAHFYNSIDPIRDHNRKGKAEYL